MQLNQDAMDKIIKHMRVYLKAGQTARALEAGLKKLEEMISCDGQSEHHRTMNCPTIIEEKGA